MGGISIENEPSARPQLVVPIFGPVGTLAESANFQTHTPFSLSVV